MSIPPIYIFTAGALVGLLVGWIIRGILFVRDLNRFAEELRKVVPDAEIETAFETAFNQS